MGPLTYRDLLELAVCRRNYRVANLVLDHMILAMLKNVDSVDFKEQGLSYKSERFQYYRLLSFRSDPFK